MSNFKSAPVKASIGLKDDPESMRPLSKKKNYTQGDVDLTKSTEVAEKMVKPGHVVSRLDHQVTLSYNGEGMCVPPRGKELVANTDLIGALPRGIFIIPAPDLTA